MAPLVSAVDGVPIGLLHQRPGLEGVGVFWLANAGQPVRIRGLQEDPHGQDLHHPLQPGFFPVLHPGERLLGLVLGVQGLQGVVDPIHPDFSGPGPVAFLYQHLHKPGLIQPCNQDYLLARTHIGASDGDQTGIPAQYRFFQIVSLLSSRRPAPG